MASVTVPGSNGPGNSATFGNQFNQALAQQISNALAAANFANALNITTAAGGVSPPVPPAVTTPGGINELVISSGGDYTIPAGQSSGSDYVVLLNTTSPVTVHGAPNTTIFGGLGSTTVIDSAVVTIAEEAGNAIANLTSSDSAVLAGNNSNDQLTAFGANQSIAGGTGANNMFALGTGDTIRSSGSRDTLSGSTSGATFLTTGTNALVFVGAGGGTVIDTGTQSTIVGAAGAVNVTMGGNKGLLFGRAGPMSVFDSGAGTTIVGGQGAATVTATGTGELLGQQSGSLDFVGGASASTVFGSPGASSTIHAGSGGVWYTNLGDKTKIFGGSGIATLFGGSGGEIIYNSSVGGAQYEALTGNETLNAAGSSTHNLIVGGSDPKGNDLLIGGSGADTMIAGSGSATMTGGAGGNDFVFFRNFTAASGNTDIITDFKNNDVVRLIGYGANQASISTANAVTSGGSLTLTLSDNTKITFLGLESTASLVNHIASS
jgi:Ca2+-binding RTX toxin-like protein